MPDRLDVVFYAIPGIVSIVYGTIAVVSPGGNDPVWLPWAFFASGLVLCALALGTYAKIKRREGQAKQESETQ